MRHGTRHRQTGLCAGVALVLAACGGGGPGEPGRDARGMHGAVTAGHPLAAQAGLAVLERGGNAMDAAITMAAVLSVARPHMNGVGGDMFLLYYDAKTDRVYGLNASGPAGSGAAIARVQSAHPGDTTMPDVGPMTVSVPGAVRGWAEVTEKKATDLAKEMEGFGVAAIIYTDIARDGMLQGPNIEATRRLAEAISIPVIASGGVSSLRDIENLLTIEASGVVGVITGKAIYTGSLDWREAVALTKRGKTM